MPLRPIFPSNPITRQDQPTTARQKGLYARKRRSSIKKHRKASRTPNRERTTQAKRGPTLLHAHDQIGYRNQGPKGNTETKTVTTSMLRAMEEASKTSGQIPWLHVTVTEAIKAWFGDWFRFLSLWKERFIFLSLSYLYPARVSSYLYIAIYMSPHFEG
jgi:hypothetical protein